MLVYKIEISQIIGVITPQMCSDGLTGEYPVLIDDKIQKQIEFLGRRIEKRLPHPGLERIGVQTDLVEVHNTRPTQVLSPVNSADTRMQLGEVKRFGDVIVRPFF